MFNLFKSEKAIIAEIHNSFDTAQDKLLKEAYEIINNSNCSAVAQLAENVGFINIPMVAKNKKVSLTKEQASRIEYYKQTYPFQKFLTEKQLISICKKYNLIYAPISNYIKNVPEKNIIEISNAKPLVYGDFCEQECILKYSQAYWVEGLSLSENRELRKGIKVLLRGGNLSRANEYFGKSFNTSYESIYWSEKQIDKSGLFIAAPKSHFNTKGLNQVGALGFLNVIEVKDPIVFRYCKGGIQVLSKWGLEASDELVVNEIEN